MAHDDIIHRGVVEDDYDVLERLPQELHSVVHDHGLSVVRAFYLHGVKKPSAIRHLVHAVLLGAREPGNRRGAKMGEGRIAIQINDALLRSGSTLTARELVRNLRQSDFGIMPLEPTPTMIAASLAEVSGHNVIVTKEQKHLRRLRAALAAGNKQFWPWLEK